MDFRQNTPYSLHTTQSDYNLQLYSDGAYFKQHHLGGWGVAIYQNDSLFATLNGVQISRSSLEMELIAAIQALQWVQTNQSNKSIALYTDAQILLEGIFDKYPNWLANNWQSTKGNPVAYAKLWQQLYFLTNSLNVDFFWIKGHANHPQNELVDQLARNTILSTQLKP